MIFKCFQWWNTWKFYYLKIFPCPWLSGSVGWSIVSNTKRWRVRTYLGCRCDSWWGHGQEATNACFCHPDISLSLYPPYNFSLWIYPWVRIKNIYFLWYSVFYFKGYYHVLVSLQIYMDNGKDKCKIIFKIHLPIYQFCFRMKWLMKSCIWKAPSTIHIWTNTLLEIIIL